MPDPRKASAKRSYVPHNLTVKLGVARPAKTGKGHGKGLWTIDYLGRHYKRRIKRAIGIDGTVVSWVTINETPIEVVGIGAGSGRGR